MSRLAWNKKTAEQEIINGLALVQAGKVTVKDSLIINNQLVNATRPTIVVCSPIGCTPMVGGYVGEGLADVAVIGNEECSPGPTSILEAIAIADRGQGVLLFLLGDAGTVLTHNIIGKQIDAAGIKVFCQILSDADVKGSFELLPVLKLAGAAAAQGKTLEEVAEIARSCAADVATVNCMEDSLQEDADAEAVAEKLIELANKRLQLVEGDSVLLLLNGNDNATVKEQLAIYGNCYNVLTTAGVKVYPGGVGNFVCGKENLFVQLCLVRMHTEWEELWNMPCSSAFFTR